MNDTSGRAQETKAMMAFLQEHSFTMSANIHSGAEVVNYPWDHTYSLHADDDWFRFVSREYADEARAVDPDYMSLFEDGITNGAKWYKISGGRQDYVTYYLEGRELTLELSNDYRLDCELLDEYWKKNERSLLNYMAQCMYGIRGRVSDLQSGLPLAALVEIPNHDQYHSAVHSSATHGDFYRLIKEGVYDVIVSADGYEPLFIQGVQVTDYQETLLDVQLEAIIKSTGQSSPVTAMQLYPNPASDRCMIYPEIEEGNHLYLAVYASNGMKVMERNLLYNGHGIEILTSDWVDGIYLISLHFESVQSTQANSLFSSS